MILDLLAEAARYTALHPLFGAAFEYLRSTPLAELPLGKHVLDGDRLYVLVAREEGRTRTGAKLEAHRKYIDIQVTIAGNEEMGWRPTAECARVETPYDAARDIAFYLDEPT